MLILTFVFAGLAALLHVFFFWMESIWWMKPAVQKVFRQKESDAAIMKLMAFNQGFYNLFLALGTIAGMALVLFGKTHIGFTLITGFCSVMLGAACILYISSPRMIRGALIQGLPPLLYLLSFIYQNPF
jgi:putative membrane protein